jgi:hypothetical protein
LLAKTGYGVSLTWISQIASLLIALGYLLVAGIYGGWGTGLGFAVILSLPLACIWFPEEMGSIATIRMRAASESSGSLIVIGGWCLLLGPILLALLG